MEEFFVSNFGVNEWVYSYILLPILIFLARIVDVSINTIRIIFVLGGQKIISTFLGFFESLIWLLAIGQIFNNLDNWVSYLAYPAGFAMGIMVGMLIEERMALGKIILRVITPEDTTGFLEFLNNKKLRYTTIRGESATRKEKILFTVIKREDLPLIVEAMNQMLPQSFYTIESVKRASETGLLPETPQRRGVSSWLSSVKRK